MVEEEESWQDPLLITDVSFQEHQHHSSSPSSSGQHQPITKNPIFPDPQSGSSKFTDPISLDDISGIVQSSKPAEMEYPNPHLNAINSIFRRERSLEESRSGDTPRSTRNKTISWQNQTNPEVIDGRSLLGFSLTTPDLVICTGSPDTPNTRNNDTFEFRQNVAASIELSLDNGIDGGDDAEVMYHTPNQDNVTGSTDFSRNPLPVICVNSGGLNKVVPFDDVEFVKDSFFTGGDVVEATTSVEDDDGEGLVLYKSARCGDFSYKFDELEAGDYIVDLHFAEIVFTSGPPGMRVFNVYIQDEKVLSAIDIYAQVGSNKPLILPDLRASVDGKGSLWIKFEGVIGKPIVCGISVWKDSQEEFSENLFHRVKENSQRGENEAQEVKLQRELAETKRALRGIKKEYELKSKECQEAWKSLRELQNELMRKSMHVGSLAYAIEGQVKEKSRWFISLRDLTKRIKILKIEHKKLSEEAMECKNCVGDVNQMAAIVQSAINQKLALEREHEDLKLKFTEGAKERKALYNKVLELKGNIRVFCRCRPLNIDEIAGGASMAIDFESAKDGELAVRANGTSKKVFKFDSVFCPQADQADVFEDTAPFATSVLDGFNVCIFAYGQTGTGKTFTMEGTEEARGVNYRTLNELFHIIRDRQGLYRYEVSVSVLEVYNEQIRDLLVPGSQPSINSKRLEIKQVADGIHHVPGLVEAHVNNMNEVWDVLQTGSNSRAVGATNANEHSSRSHCIHCVMVKGENLMNGECTRSKLWLVDLAGSERVAKTDVQGDRLKETQNINRSLSALGDVIFALATKSPHIPFRNSKLTHLLQDSLGGDSKTLMFLQISPNENDLSETLCSLNFASRVRGIELGPAKKQFDSSELIKYKQMAEKAKQDIKSKDGYIKKLEDNIYGLESKAKARDLNNKSLQEKVKELESQLMVERRLARQHVDSKIAEQQQQQQKQLQDEQILTSGKPLVSTQPFGNHKKASEPTTNALAKDESDHIRPLTEKNSLRPSLPPPTDTFSKYSFTEKENKPDMTEHPVMPRRTGRLSICPTSHHIPEASNPRRNSLIPLPMSGRVALAPTVVPLQAHNSPEPMQDAIQEADVNNPEKTPPCTLRGPRTGSKKINSILRRSLQKKVQIKSPMQQNRRGGGGGLNGGMEKVRLSIGGGKGRAGLRARGAKELTNQKEKEKRGWNF